MCILNNPKHKNSLWECRKFAYYFLVTLAILLYQTASHSQDAEGDNLHVEMMKLKAQMQALEQRILTRQQQTTTSQQVVEKKPQLSKPIDSYTSPAPPSKTPPSIISSEKQHPAWNKKFYLHGITFTPGGFMAGEGVWRARNEQTDMGSTFSGIPLGNNPLAYMRELRLSARQTRNALLVEGRANPTTLVSGYVEIDYLGNGTADSSESNSFSPRMRALYATVDWEHTGWHVLAGQNWSLATTSRQGISPRKELIPFTIDAQYVVGFVWKRQAQLRITKQLGPSLWTAVSLENPQNTFGGTFCETAFGNIESITCRAFGTQTLPPEILFSLNHVPDVIAKFVSVTPVANRTLHIEGLGIYRDFYDRVKYTNQSATNKNSTGYGVGGSVLIDIVPRVIDFQANALVGRGIGSYASGLLPDVTIAQSGSLAPIPEIIYMVGAGVYITPTLRLYLYGGEEKVRSTYFKIDNTYYGYGTPTADTSGCNIINRFCDANTSHLWQVTTGFWKKIYHGDLGELRAGMQYSYTVRNLFPGNANKTSNDVGYGINEQMVFASLRYYPFIDATPSVGVVG